jgi:dTDP-4-amino-4,6-dideoxygalactose transaminase
MIKANELYLKPEWLDGLESYLSKQSFNHEEITREFESKICELTGSRFAITTSSATTSILMILMMWKTEINEVILPNYGHPAAKSCCDMLDIKVIPVDINEDTLMPDVTSIEEAITPNTLAYIHIESNAVLGNNIEEIKLLCKKHGVTFIEDAAPSMLQFYGKKRAGRFGDLGIYSFSPTKPLCSGEGSVIVTDSYLQNSVLSKMRSDHDDINRKLSLNFALSSFLIAYLLPQLESLEEIGKKRELNHTLYKENGLNVFEQQGVTNRYPYVMYLSKNASKISNDLKKFKIGHRYKYYPLVDPNLPNSKKVQSQLIDLPCGMSLTPDQIKAVCNIIRRAEK